MANSVWITSLLAVASGCIVATRSGYGPGTWGRNIAAWLIGLLLANFLRRIHPAQIHKAALIITPLLLFGTLVSPGLDGIHRWISLGPLTWNVAFLTLPAFLVALVNLHSRWTWLAACLVAIDLYIQPDASQSTAFAIAAIWLLWQSSLPTPFRILLTIFFLSMAGASWALSDPLQPVPEVEGIILLAYSLSALAALLCVAALLATCLAPLTAKPPATALTLYFLTCSIMPLLGAFPVPFVGMGMSPILGYWLGTAAMRSYSPTPSK